MFKFSIKLILSLVIVFFVSSCVKKDAKEERLVSSKILDLIIYRVDGLVSEHIDSETLSKTSYICFDKKLAEKFFSNVKFHSRSKVIWKGSWLGIAKLKNGKEKRLRISMSGAYYNIVGHQGYYETTEESHEIFRKKMNEALEIWQSETNNP
jgi:hypothetical protein